MQKLKHTKVKDIGLIVELTSRTLINFILENKKPIDIVNTFKKHFHKNSLLLKEYQLYKLLTDCTVRSNSEAFSILNDVGKYSLLINEDELARQSQRYLSEINNFINIKDFFKQPVKNYRLNASIQQFLHETRNPSGISNIMNKNRMENLIIENMIITHKTTKKEKLKDIGENKIDDLTYYIILEQFNSKYKNILPEQKLIINDFITSMDDKNKFDKKLKNEAKSLIENFDELSKKIDDEQKLCVKMKIIKKRLFNILNESKSVNNDNILLILNCQLLKNKLKEL
jgi:hypothetical protein